MASEAMSPEAALVFELPGVATFGCVVNTSQVFAVSLAQGANALEGAGKALPHSFPPFSISSRPHSVLGFFRGEKWG